MNDNLTIEKIFKLAIQNHKENNFDVAQNLYNEILKINPNHINALSNLGAIFKQIGKYQKAINCYEKAIEINPNNAPIYSNLGIVFAKLKEYQKAINFYEKAIKIDPNLFDAFNNLSMTLFDLGSLKEAKINCERAIKLKPDYAVTHFTLGNIQRDMGSLNEAVESYRIVIKLKPDYIDAYFNLGTCYKKLGNMSEAIEYFYKVLAINPDYNIRYHLGSILESEAKFHFHKAFKKTALDANLYDATLYSKKILKRNVSINENTINLLNKLTESVNKLYGFLYLHDVKKNFPSINAGPCGAFANEFYMQWNSRFISQVKIAFVMFQKPFESYHVLIKLPNGDLFDGGVGVHNFDHYQEKRSELNIMEKYDLEILDKYSWGLAKTNHKNCPDFSLSKVSSLITKSLNSIYDS